MKRFLPDLLIGLLIALGFVLAGLAPLPPWPVTSFSWVFPP